MGNQACQSLAVKLAVLYFIIPERDIADQDERGGHDQDPDHDRHKDFPPDSSFYHGPDSPFWQQEVNFFFSLLPR